MPILASLTNALALLATARELHRVFAPGAAPTPEQLTAIRGLLGLPASA